MTTLTNIETALAHASELIGQYHNNADLEQRDEIEKLLDHASEHCENAIEDIRRIELIKNPPTTTRSKRKCQTTETPIAPLANADSIGEKPEAISGVLFADIVGNNVSGKTTSTTAGTNTTTDSRN